MSSTERSYYDSKQETMPFKARQAYYDEKVRWIVEHGYQHAPAVKAKMDQAGVSPQDIHSVKDLEKIPVTSKDELMQLQKENPPFGGFLTVPVSQLQSICMSPGPLYNSPGLEDSYLRRVEKAFFGCGIRPGDILLNTFSYHMSPMGILLDTPLKRLGVTVIPMGGGNKPLQLQVMHDLKVTVFTGSAGFLLELLRTAGEAGYDVKKDFNLRLAISPFDHEAMKIIEKEYGIKGTEFYGTADLGIAAYQCAQRKGMHFCEEMIVEIVDMNTNKQLGPQQVGKVVLTPLDKSMPLIRFSPGDLSSWEEESCPCGRTSYRLNPIVGWIGQAMKVRGMFVHPSQLAAVAAKFPQIERYQLVCHRINQKDILTFNFEAKDDSVITKEMSESFKAVFLDLCRLNMDNVKCISKGTISADGKSIVDERPQSAK